MLLDYARRIEGADAALLYFAGHGIQVKGQNYLIPVNADIREEFQLKRRAFALNDLLDLMVSNARARSGLVFLDACRDDPFSRSLRSGTIGAERSRYLARSGLAKMEAMQGSFIAFATEPDNVADDGTGDHSPFTEALLQHIETPDISIGDMMIEVRNHVWKATNGRQRPWDQSSLSQRFFFKVSEKPSPLAPSVAMLLPAPTTMDRPSQTPVSLPAKAIASVAKVRRVSEHGLVAQICNLPNRRIAFCGPSTSASALELSDPLPIANRRYSRLQICATLNTYSPTV